MESIRPIISGVVGGLISVAVFWWAANSAVPTASKDTAYFSWRYRLITVVMLCISGITPYVAFQAFPQQRPLALSVTAAFVLFCLVCVLDAFVSRARALSNGLELRSPWRRLRVIPWEAFTGHIYREALEVHVLTTSGYGKVNLPKLMTGVDNIVKRAKRRRGPSAR